MEYAQIKQAIKHTILFIIRIITLLLRTLYTACLSMSNGVKEIWNDSKVIVNEHCSCHENNYSRGQIVDFDVTESLTLREGTKQPKSRQQLVYCSKHFPKNEDTEIVPLDSVEISYETPTEPDAHGKSLGDWPEPIDDDEDLWKEEYIEPADRKSDAINFGSLISNTVTPLAPLIGEYTIDPSRFTASLSDAPLTAAIKAN